MMKATAPGRWHLLSWIMLFLLFVAYNISVIDRIILSLLVEPIKAELGISDTQVSLLQGFAFFLIYSVAGIPLGYLVDRVRRMSLIAVGIGIWSLMTGLCGIAANFWLLFACRAGVGIGEASLTPCAHSLIANSFPRERLGLALGIFSIGGTTGAGIALIIGGALIVHLQNMGEFTLPLLGAMSPWRMAFLLLGLPGLVLSLIFLFFPEPPRHRESKRKVPPREQLATAQDFYGKNWRQLLPLHLGVGLSNMAFISALSWVAPFLTRAHDWSMDIIGLWAGGANIVAGLFGLIVGGAISDRLARGGDSSRLIVCVIAAPIGALSGALFPIVGNGHLAIAGFTILQAMTMMVFGVSAAFLQAIVPDRVRGMSAAVYLLAIGFMTSMGPTATALISDSFFPGGDGIRYGLAIFCSSALGLSAICFSLLYSFQSRHRPPASDVDHSGDAAGRRLTT